MKTITHLTLALLALAGILAPAHPLVAAEADAPALEPLSYNFHPRTYNWRPSRMPVLTLRFNAEMAPKKAQVHLFFESDSGQAVPAQVRRPNAEELEAVRKYVGALEEEDDEKHYLTVQPSRKLPVGSRWKLILNENLETASNEQKLSSRRLISVGSIRPMSVTWSGAETPWGADRFLQLTFSKPVHESAVPHIGKYVTLNPAPEDLKVESDERTVYLRGTFEYGTKYRVHVRGGIMADDELMLEDPWSRDLTFKPNDAFVTLPAFDAGQNLAGAQDFGVRSGNLSNLRVRVRQLDGDSLIYALRGYDVYLNYEEKHLPFEMVPGKTLMDRTFSMKKPMDQPDLTDLNWKKLRGAAGGAALFISAEGYSRSHPHLPSQKVVSQSVIQLTDLGVLWKMGKKGSAMAWVFSLKTGQPMPGAKVELRDQDNALLSSHHTDNQGIAQFSLAGKNAAVQWLLAEKEDVRYAMRFQPDQRALSLWSMGVNQAWRGEPDVLLSAQMFSDRGIYRPGDTVHLKAIVRSSYGHAPELPKEGGFPAMLTVRDSQGRQILERSVTFSDLATADITFQLPDGVTGGYNAQLDFSTLLEEIDPDTPIDRHYDRHAWFYFPVAEYRPNTFEVTAKVESEYAPDSEITVPVEATYFRGRNLSDAEVQWYSYWNSDVFRPYGYDDYVFGDSEADYQDGSSDSEEVKLGTNGKVELALDYLQDAELEQPARVHLNVDVTDINQQTIHEGVSFLLHASDQYLGIALGQNYSPAGQEVTARLTAVHQDGTPALDGIEATMKVERKVWTTIMVKGAGGGITHRNEWKMEPVLERKVMVKPGKNGDPVRISWMAEEPGYHRVILEGEDASGKKIRTVASHYIYGGRVWWAANDGDVIELNPEKENWAAGDTARILVNSPILGQALVTVERAGVHRKEVIELTENSQFIDVPIRRGDAPNVFVSVMVLRGSADSPHQHPETDYRIGYCNLLVEQPSDTLDVEVDVIGEVMPREEVEVTASVKDHRGEAVTGAEVTLWAVDEGVLSLTGYQNPDPANVFHTPQALRVWTSHSLLDLLPEDPDKVGWGNKGRMIGGGGEGLMNPDNNQTRKDFKATPLWAGALRTDESGQVRATFKAPDNLTEFRVVAVVIEGAASFGVGEGSVKVSKPVIMEPALPAFANVGDELIFQAVVHNTTRKPGTFEVKLEADEHLSIGTDLNFQKVALEDVSATQWTQEVELPANSTRALRIPVTIAKAGEANWTWSVRDLNGAPRRSDKVETTLEIGYPVPILRNIHFGKADGNLLASIEQDLLKGLGQMDVTISNSRLLGALDALEYNLRYPYGCVEQTTSSTLPWLTMKPLLDVFPNLQKTPEEVEDAIEYGTKRILSMQTWGGGISYWPGADQPSVWGSAYGGMCLALAVREGYEFPQERLDQLWDYLSDHIRSDAKPENEERIPQWQYERALILHTLALAGRPESSYHEVLFKDREKLSAEARSFLALAIVEGGVKGQRPMAEALLKGNFLPEQLLKPWHGRSLPLSLNLRTELKLNPKSEKVDELTRKLMTLRSGPMGWGSTWKNSWPLLALADLAHEEASVDRGQEGTLTFGNDFSEAWELGAETGSVTRTIDFDGDVRDQGLQVIRPEDAPPAWVHLEVATRPAELSLERQANGFEIGRRYFLLEPDGTTTESQEFSIGDLVVVDLAITAPEGAHEYLAIDDPLPAVFETVNPVFESRAGTSLGKLEGDRLYTSFQEFRTDRALFFTNYLNQAGTWRIQYLVRVVAAGNVTAPPARIEAMYEPEKYGLSATTRIRVPLPARSDGKVALLQDN